MPLPRLLPRTPGHSDIYPRGVCEGGSGLLTWGFVLFAVNIARCRMMPNPRRRRYIRMISRIIRTRGGMMGGMDRTCGHCGSSIGLLRGGATYCSPRCRAAAHRARKPKQSKFPPVMRRADRWVRVLKSKAPVQCSGRLASVTDPSTWASFEEAGRSKVGVGLGWVLGEGIGCIDLDHCIVDGVLEPWARDLVDEFRDEAVLVEVSRSGEGVHVFVPMEPGRGSRSSEGGRHIEVYPPDSGRYIAVTGNTF